MTIWSLAFALATPSHLPDPIFPTFAPPAGNQPARVAPGGTTILPNGRFLTPAGKRLWSGDGLWGLALSPDGSTVVGIHTDAASATEPSPGLTVYTNMDAAPQKSSVSLKDLAPAGVFTPDGSRFIVSSGEDGGIRVLNAKTWTPITTISANVGGVNDSFINDLVLVRGGRYACGVDVANQDVVTFDLTQGVVLGRAKAGRQPYACAISADEKTLFVANIGIFDYSVIPKPEGGKGNLRGLSLPAFAFPSAEAEKGMEREGRSVPGLGSPYVADAQSVWAFDVTALRRPSVSKKAKSGILIHGLADAGKAVGASAPNELLVHRDELFVANANNDTVSVFATKGLTLKRTIKLSPHPSVAKLRGVIPSGMAMNKAGTRLYVCESGLNAVAVVEPKSGRTLGHIPTGWFPMEVRLSPDDHTLYIATQKGLGRGPRGRKNIRTKADERFGLVDMPGMIDRVGVPSQPKLADMTREVLRNNGLMPIRPTQASELAGTAGRPSDKIKYVVFITKENHTFDGIFGADIPGSAGEPDYAEFGLKGWIEEKGRSERVPIMPNHIKLAQEFAISDNFYMEPQASGDGHRWLVGVYPSLWTTRVFYAGWNFKASNTAKGRLVSFGSDGSQIPEDYLENGSLFEHLHRGGISMRNYGEGYELPQTDEGWMANKAGTFYPYNHPMPKVLYDHTCFEFPAYNNNIPDIARFEWFVEDLEKNYFSKGKGLPQFLNIAICNDHGARPNPKYGFPYVASYMADNDLALGKIVEFLSHRPEWKEMMVFVTQDDPGGDDDHVDRHRSFVLAIGPWAKRGYVSHVHTSIMSIIRSIYQLFGLGPNNMFDALSADLSDMFAAKPNYAPYTSVGSDPRVFKPEETVDPNDPKFERRRKEAAPVRMDDPAFVDWLRKRNLMQGG